MKLVLCKSCQDVIRLIQSEVRTCKCGNAGGKYLNELDAVYFGEFAIPLGFQNSSVVQAIRSQPENGLGVEFTAFVIPKECPTFKRVDIKHIEEKNI